MYAGAVRINLAKFFKYTGVFLILVAAGVLSYGIGAMQTVGWLPGLGSKAFDISNWFDWSAWYGAIIQGVFNTTPTPTVLQLSCWLAYLVMVLALFLRPTRPAPKPQSANEISTENTNASEVSTPSADSTLSERSPQ
jgi:high-affinity iron transporter